MLSESVKNIIFLFSLCFAVGICWMGFLLLPSLLLSYVGYDLFLGTSHEIAYCDIDAQNVQLGFNFNPLLLFSWGGGLIACIGTMRR